jgi:hypothetical protein
MGEMSGSRDSRIRIEFLEDVLSVLDHRSLVIWVGTEDDLGLGESEAIHLLVLVELRSRLREMNVSLASNLKLEIWTHLDSCIRPSDFLKPSDDNVGGRDVAHDNAARLAEDLDRESLSHPIGRVLLALPLDHLIGCCWWWCIGAGFFLGLGAGRVGRGRSQWILQT